MNKDQEEEGGKKKKKGKTKTKKPSRERYKTNRTDLRSKLKRICKTSPDAAKSFTKKHTSTDASLYGSLDKILANGIQKNLKGKERKILRMKDLRVHKRLINRKMDRLDERINEISKIIDARKTVEVQLSDAQKFVAENGGEVDPKFENFLLITPEFSELYAKRTKLLAKRDKLENKLIAA